MAPFIAALISAGLNGIAGAVAAKGKEVVQEKLGVNIDELLGSDEGRAKLAQIQMDKEEMLLEMAQKQDAMIYADIADARAMNTRINETANASWLSKNIAALLALVTVAGGGSMLAFSPNADVRTAAVGLVTIVLGFYFGSNVRSKNKDEVIADMARSKV